MVELLKYGESAVTEALELEALMDVSNILIGACLNALSDQLNVKFSHNYPIILGLHCNLDSLLQSTISRWNKVMAIEIGYSIKKHDIQFDLLLLIVSSKSPKSDVESNKTTSLELLLISLKPT